MLFGMYSVLALHPNFPSMLFGMYTVFFHPKSVRARPGLVDISAGFFSCEHLRVAPVLREVASVMDGPAVAVLSRSILCLPITTPSGHLTTLDFITARVFEGYGVLEGPK